MNVQVIGLMLLMLLQAPTHPICAFPLPASKKASTQVLVKMEQIGPISQLQDGDAEANTAFNSDKPQASGYEMPPSQTAEAEMATTEPEETGEAGTEPTATAEAEMDIILQPGRAHPPAACECLRNDLHCDEKLSSLSAVCQPFRTRWAQSTDCQWTCCVLCWLNPTAMLCNDAVLYELCASVRSVGS